MRTLVVSLIAALVLSAGGYSLYRTTADVASSSPSPSNTVRPVNSVIGNESFRATFGTAPSRNTPERLRLQTHLAYVEALLRSRPRPSLSPDQKTRRSAMLDALRQYWMTGQFPRNTEVSGRSPVFIDEQGRLCAVGHLVAVSAGRHLAERIDSRYHLADVREIEMPVLDQWARRHGFTRRELAMIQPMYDGCCVVGPAPKEEEKPSAVEISALSASVGASIVNGVLLEQNSPSLVGGAVGVVSGGTSLAIGLGDDAGYPTASSVAGITSVVLGGWELVAGLRQTGSDKSTSAHRSSMPNSRAWSVTPTTVTTVTGTTQPGVRATVQF
jgi:hypothetical protein